MNSSQSSGDNDVQKLVKKKNDFKDIFYKILSVKTSYCMKIYICIDLFQFIIFIKLKI